MNREIGPRGARFFCAGGKPPGHGLVAYEQWSSGQGFMAFVGGPSGPMPLFQIAATGSKSIGPEGPPTKAGFPSASQRLRMKT
ncbi:DUF6053 domain-containing protein [Lysobacter yananisis]|uniref:DUF6053 domain-containing protein n=1 Tax=Lysobacter yananisis TaxID=1003114 RepID=UPI003CE54C45